MSQFDQNQQLKWKPNRHAFFLELACLVNAFRFRCEWLAIAVNKSINLIAFLLKGKYLISSFSSVRICWTPPFNIRSEASLLINQRRLWFNDVPSREIVIHFKCFHFSPFYFAEPDPVSSQLINLVLKNNLLYTTFAENVRAADRRCRPVVGNWRDVKTASNTESSPTALLRRRRLDFHRLLFVRSCSRRKEDLWWLLCSWESFRGILCTTSGLVGVQLQKIK